MKKNLFWFLSIAVVMFCMFSVHDFDSRYGRSINGDAKGYYAYLPALFIYQDPSFSFIDEVEAKYYPEDGSQFKDFRNKQKNGKYVNKTFPGLSILYAPFFFLSMLVAWIGGFAIDGYSAPFQWGIAFSHIVYFFIGLRFLLSFFRRLKIRDSVSYLLFIVILFGTNIWYYLIYDHSVSHIHNFFLACIFLWTMLTWLQTKQIKYLGISGVILALLVITRPTNMVMVLFLPLLMSLCSVTFKEMLSKHSFQFKPLIPYFSIGLLILSIPFIFWKWQSGLWLVYSYNEEGFDFNNPQLFNFLFSYEKGWFLWSPLLFISFLGGCYYFAKRSFFDLFYYLLPISVIVYILSSWWCWTYGAGFGQRPMIEYIPFVSIGVAFILQKVKKIAFAYLFILPFCFLSLFQAYQIANSILVGGTTTKAEYWSHFLQWKGDSPKVKIDAHWKLIERRSLHEKHKINVNQPFSKSLKTSKLDSISKVILRLEIGSRSKEPNLRLVVTNQDASFYKDIYIAEFLNEEPTLMEFAMDLPGLNDQIYTFYVWNGDTAVEAEINLMEIISYR